MKEILLQGDCIMNGFGEWILSVNCQFKMLTWQVSSYSNGNGKLYSDGKDVSERYYGIPMVA